MKRPSSWALRADVKERLFSTGRGAVDLIGQGGGLDIWERVG